MTPSELDEVWCVGTLGGHVSQWNSPSLLVWLPTNGLLNILLFCYFCCTWYHSKHHNFGTFEKQIAPLWSSKNKLSFGMFNSLVLMKLMISHTLLNFDLWSIKKCSLDFYVTLSGYLLDIHLLVVKVSVWGLYGITR